jgi:hypothetical protein
VSSNAADNLEERKLVENRLSTTGFAIGDIQLKISSVQTSTWPLAPADTRRTIA